jgi:biotin transporter BioY
VKKLSLSLGMAYLVGLLAQIRMSLPWPPVPITGQTFGVLLATEENAGVESVWQCISV